jgi:hypothetical protein
MEIREDCRYPASLLDAEQQELSSGEALVRLAQHYAAFWPRLLPTDEADFLKRAALLQIRDGPTIPIKKVEPCLSAGSRHYDCHFD